MSCGYPWQVLTRVDLRGEAAASLGRQRLDGVLPRARLNVEAALDAVRPVCEDVRLRGAAAVREQTRRFDGVDLPSTRVPRQALADALAELSPDVAGALQEAGRRGRPVPGAPVAPGPGA